jgi:hypothetical protein
MITVINDTKYNYGRDGDIEITSNGIIPDNCIELKIYTEKSIDHIKIPDSVKKITFYCEYLHPINDLKFPPNLQELFIVENFKDIKNIKINDDCLLSFRDNNHNEMFDNLPSNIKKIKIDGIMNPLLNLPSNLQLLEYRIEGICNILDGTMEVDVLSKCKIPWGCVVRKYY